ncbi:MAG: translesion DNA synthesis-associated protein ImuA [Gammaproteobacteria bacterium]|nr:translesion DNA synthesis-associated protein ImuA [Gammaproteobacteria bacterium]MBU1647539.1 translesion DNA synthesis-associated protein ImuA [Gammaproteobacteria bacterium]MBU1972988.1 translesion DNA synthesis-associated protein ImuA [Gammaproteobacteria bacterium]
MSALAEVLLRPDIRRGDQFAVAPAHPAGCALGVPTFASGFAALDAELPGGGWPRGALTEILVDGHGLGELSLLLPALRGLRAGGDWVLAIAPPDGNCTLHAPAWAAAGVDLERLAVVSPAAARDALWAAEQALLSGAPQAVLCWSAAADSRAVRRLQVAAAQGGQGGAVAFLFRPLRCAREPSAAALRLSLAAAPQGALAVTILKRRGPPLAEPIVLALPRPAAWRNHVSSLAGATPAVRSLCAA